MQWKKIIIVMAAILIPMAFPVNLIIKDIIAKPIAQTYDEKYDMEAIGGHDPGKD